jgi:hypothetical protein
VVSRFLTMTRTAKRGISNAAAMAAWAVCLVAAAAIVMVPVLALAQHEADQAPPSHAPVDSVSIDVVWDAAQVSHVALADLLSQRSPVRTGQLADIGQAERLDAGSLRAVPVPSDALRDACADFAADAARDRLVAIRACQADAVRGHSAAGPVHPSRHLALPRMRVAHAGGHAAIRPAACRRSRSTSRATAHKLRGAVVEFTRQAPQQLGHVGDICRC